MEVENDESFVDSANEAVQNFNSKTIDINATESVLTSEIDLLFQGPETKFRTVSPPTHHLLINRMVQVKQLKLS